MKLSENSTLIGIHYKATIPFPVLKYDEESDHSNKAVRKTPEIESGHKVSEEVK